MECLDSRCASMLLDWIKARSEGRGESIGEPIPRQTSLFTSAPYQDDAPSIRTHGEFAGAVEHLEYAIFRRYQNQLTRAERSRLDNSIENAMFKADRYATGLESTERSRVEDDLEALKAAQRTGKERVERLHRQAKRADLKLAQLASLTPEGFEEFVAEVFEAMGYEVEVMGGTGDEGADLLVRRKGQLGVVQCKYHKKGIVGSPELQKFLGTVHHTRSHKGFFVTTRTFSLAAERFVAEHPIELIDGSRLIELVQEAIGPGARREPEPAWF